MMLRPLLIFWLIVYSVRFRTRPWNFFQLNSDYFNGEKNLFSKLEINQYIPLRWRLWQVVDDGEIVPEFPIFVKPEWGQNSHGVVLVRDLAELNDIRCKRSVKTVTYLMQEAAKETREFEIFYIRAAGNPEDTAQFSVTETVNCSGTSLPVNGINNRDSLYQDRTESFGKDELQNLWEMMKAIGFFRIARVGVRANSIEELLLGNFHVIEVNIFLPMPLVLLDREVGWTRKHQFIRESMKSAARLAGNGFRPLKRYPIFLRYGRELQFPTAMQQQSALSIRTVVGFTDRYNSRLIFSIDGIFLYMESYFWLISLFLVVGVTLHGFLGNSRIIVRGHESLHATLPAYGGSFLHLLFSTDI